MGFRELMPIQSARLSVPALALLLLSGVSSPSLADGLGWKPFGAPADWSGRDFSCTVGANPVPALCNTATIGSVAVCWMSRQSGECGGAVAWCTYKNVSVASDPANGSSPGAAYLCAQ